MYYSWWSWAIPLQILLLFKAKKTQIGTINVQTNRQGEKWNLKLSKTLQIVHKLLPLQGVKAVTHDFFYYNDKSGLKICLPPPYQKIPCTVTEIADSQVRQFQLHFILVYWSRYNLPCTYKQLSPRLCWDHHKMNCDTYTYMFVLNFNEVNLSKRWHINSKWHVCTTRYQFYFQCD